MTIWSSWSFPIVLPPFFSRTPRTLKGTFLTRITAPTGSESGKRFCLTELPRTATLAAAFTSASEKKEPDARFHERMKGQSTSAPNTSVDQLFSPATTDPAVRAPGETYATDGHSTLIARASSSGSDDCAEKIRAPPAVTAPGKIMMTFAPSELMFD